MDIDRTAAVISEKGRRPYMEDTYFLDLNFAGRGWIFAGIYDGHNGVSAAAYAATRLHEIFRDRLLAGQSPGLALRESYETTSSEIKDESGTTAVNFLVKGDKIFTANAGDTRAIIVDNRGFHQLTVDHRLDNPSERERVEKEGAQICYPYVMKGDRGLMPTRSIGDRYFKSVGVIAAPSTGEYGISRHDFMLVAACDGLFDFMSNAEVAYYARTTPEPEALLDKLKNEVLVNRSGMDNLTIITVKLKNL